MNDREFPAKYTVFWPGQTVHVCQTHFDGLMRLNKAMGCGHLDFREEPDKECMNCVSEAKKEMKPLSDGEIVFTG